MCTKYADMLIVCQTGGITLAFPGKLGQSMVEGGVNKVLELLEDGGNAELINIVWLYSERDAIRELPVG